MIPPGSVVFDVGAHIGFFTLWFAKLVGPQGRVVAFEPCPQNTPLLDANVRLNTPRTANVRVVPAAVGREKGTIMLQTSGGVSTMSRVGGLPLTGADHLVRTATVECLALDSFTFDRSLQPSHIKIDVEGAELDVLEGARRVLAELRPIVFLEAHFSIADMRPLTNILAALNYECLDLNGRLVDEDAIAEKRRIEWLILCPTEKLSSLQDDTFKDTASKAG